MLQNMKAAGYEPDQVDMVLITHMHPDHIGGLSDAAGKPIFQKAQVVVSQLESDFWMSQKVADAAPAQAQSRFKMARDIAAPYQAGGQWKTFVKDTELVPGIKPVTAVGHTPGHTAFAVESEGQKLLIWGDLVHAHAVQFAKPGVSIDFDVDQKQAVETRLRIMKEVAAGKSLVAGMHLPFPGIGHVRADGEDSYSWVPIVFGPLAQTEKESKAVGSK
jgi:glyoxylase-like metal-dependent hydrolase (beta-lactamase superfamily II)